MSDPLDHAERNSSAHVCTGCRHVERCRAGLACEAMAVFVKTGRISTVAPRQPSAAIFERIYRKEPPRFSRAEKVIKREAAAVSAMRGRY